MSDHRHVAELRLQRYWRESLDNNWHRIATHFHLRDEDKPTNEFDARTLYLRWCDEIKAT